MADNAQSILRRLREIKNDPQGVLAQLMDNIQNFNKGRVAEIRPEGAGYRTLTPKERTAQIVGGALENIGGGSMGALGVIKSKGGNWLTGSVENALKPLRRAFAEMPTDVPPEVVADPRYAREAQRRAGANALNNWIEGPLTKYVKRDMATEGDPVRALAERGVLHVDPEQLPRYTGKQTTRAGDIRQLAGETPLAKQWDEAADYSFYTEPASQALNRRRTLEKNPWLAKVPPETPVYSTTDISNPGALGFSHLVDELSNALNPESGLPRNLLLTPEQMQQMGMEKAVRHVADINAWRAAQKAEADALKANNAATVLHKEYPENNPRGLRWVELKAPKGRTPDEFEQSIEHLSGPEWTKAIEEYKLGEREEPRRMLQDALKYEGDTMGHCVGGYCDKVLSGDTRIFSLRDAKGQPHVTIETRPYSPTSTNVRDLMKAAGEQEGQAIWKEYTSSPESVNMGLSSYLKMKHPEAWDKIYRGPDSIIQIKGKANLAPKEEYLPFVQDFVKSGKWSDVGDLQNAGLFRADKLRKGATLGLPETDYQALHKAMYEANPDLVSFSHGLSELIPEGVEYMTRDELMNLIKSKQNFAQGGLVKRPTWRPMELDGIIGYITE